MSKTMQWFWWILISIGYWALMIHWTDFEALSETFKRGDYLTIILGVIVVFGGYWVALASATGSYSHSGDTKLDKDLINWNQTRERLDRLFPTDKKK